MNIGYKYREVFCPLCERKFMWEETAMDGSHNVYYKNKTTGEVAGRAKCTTCGIHLIVLPGVLTGVLPENMPEMELRREYGI